MDELTKALVLAATNFGMRQAADVAEAVAKAHEERGNHSGAHTLREFASVLRDGMK